AQGLGALKAAAAAQVAAGNAAVAQKQAPQAVTGFVNAIAEAERAKEMDGKRGETAKRQAVGRGKQQEARQRGADVEATGSWQRAEAAMTAAQQAFESGDFDLADMRLGDATAAYDAAAGASGAIRDARAKLASKDFGGAANAGATAGQADLGNEAARKLTGEIRVAAAMEAATPAKTRGETAGRDIAALADAQGFAARKSQVQQGLAQAAEAWGRAAYEEAAWRYEAVVASAGKVKEGETKRQEIAKRQAVGRGEREEGRKREGEKAAPTLWGLGEAAMTAAGQAYEGGEFEEARGLVDEAAGWWTRAGELGEALGKAQAMATAGKAPEAVTTLRAVQSADPASAPATTAMQAIELTARKAAVADWPKAAEAALAQAAPIADTEGFAAGKQAAQQMRTAAADHFAGGRFEQAAISYATAVGACEQLKASDARRKAVAAAKAQADALAPKAQAVPDSPGLQPPKAYAVQEYQAAVAWFAAARFEEAGRRFAWSSAMMDKLLALEGADGSRSAVRQGAGGRAANAGARVHAVGRGGANGRAGGLRASRLCDRPAAVGILAGLVGRGRGRAGLGGQGGGGRGGRQTRRGLGDNPGRSGRRVRQHGRGRAGDVDSPGASPARERAVTAAGGFGDGRGPQGRPGPGGRGPAPTGPAARDRGQAELRRQQF
ncbi:MAG: hypothetical protein NT031_18100, partial [Planctomycetota bacterium]|nr:hypothetical protein [Planctomycetota bacterium]